MVSIPALHAHEAELTAQFLAGVAQIPGVKCYGRGNLEGRVGVIALDFLQQDNGEVAYRLENEFGILTRCGLHCAPAAHCTLGTFPRGVVRFSLGFANTAEEIDYALSAIAQVTQG